MAHFIGELQGSRGTVTRLGTPDSGIQTIARGWNVGVYVMGRKEDDGDVFTIYAFTIYADARSNGRAAGFCVGTVKLVDGKVTFISSKEKD